MTPRPSYPSFLNPPYSGTEIILCSTFWFLVFLVKACFLKSFFNVFLSGIVTYT